MTARSRWILLGVYSLIVWGSSKALEARLRGSVELPCELQQWSHPIKELLIYWQRELHGEQVLVAGVIDGKANTANQHEEYKGRASLNLTRVEKGDFTLHLSDLSLQDSGTYLCVVFRNLKTIIELHRNTTELHVTAEYSTPVITSAAPKESCSEQKLTCTTQGGTPQPEIRWMNASDGTPMQDGQIQNSIDQDKDFMIVTSTITINVTSTTNFSCVILTTIGNLTSNTYMLEVTDGNTEIDKQHGVAPAVQNTIVIVLVLLVAVVLGILVLKGKSFPAGCSRRVKYQQGKTEMVNEQI